ncbi:MAG: hypothetical protein R2748_02940 [Bryobacterales bacterium]
MGIRYEWDTPLWDRNNRMNSFDWNQINPVSGLPGVVTFAPATAWYAHKTYAAAWAAFGLAYQRLETVIRTATASTTASTTARCRTLLRSVQHQLTCPTASATFYLDQACRPPRRRSSAPATARSSSAKRMVSPQYPERNPMVQQWNFGIQRQLPRTSDRSHLHGQRRAPARRSNFNWNMIP